MVVVLVAGSWSLMIVVMVVVVLCSFRCRPKPSHKADLFGNGIK